MTKANKIRQLDRDRPKGAGRKEDNVIRGYIFVNPTDFVYFKNTMADVPCQLEKIAEGGPVASVS
jgi:hypothetical protein